jgi:hypothetical protein
MSSTLRPQIDPELAPALEMLPKERRLGTLEAIIGMRKIMELEMGPSTAASDPEISVEEISFEGPDGNAIELVILRKKNSIGDKRPCLYNIHGGGMILGTRHMFITTMFPYVKEFDLVSHNSFSLKMVLQRPLTLLVGPCFS